MAGKMTKGPWHLGRVTGGDAYIWGVDQSERGYVACVNVAGSPTQQVQRHGNVRAIAEVPAMVEALRLIDDRFSKATAKGVNGRPTVADLNAIFTATRAILARIDGEG